MFVEPIKDHKLRIKPTTKLIDFIIKEIKRKDKVPDSLVALKNRSKRENVLINLEDLKWLHTYLKERNKSTNDKVYLHELLKETEISLPEPFVRPRNPELIERIKKLRAQQNARDYAEMTSGVNPYKKIFPQDSIAVQMREMNKQLIAVAQFIFSVAAGFVFGFLGIELLVGDLDFGFRLLLGIMMALLIALAEIYFLAKKLNEDTLDYNPIGKINKVHED